VKLVHEPFLELLSHAEDVTITATIGGYQVGFEAVVPAMISRAGRGRFGHMAEAAGGSAIATLRGGGCGVHADCNGLVEAELAHVGQAEEDLCSEEPATRSRRFLQTAPPKALPRAKCSAGFTGCAIAEG
jgi:hypothetical protein